jgi:hypothetical protein
VGREDVVDIIGSLGGAVFVFRPHRLERDHLLPSHERTDERGQHALDRLHRVAAYDGAQPIAAVAIVRQVVAAIEPQRFPSGLTWPVVLEPNASVSPLDNHRSEVRRRDHFRHCSAVPA